MPDGISNNNYPPEYKFYKVAFSYSTKQLDFVRKVAELLLQKEGINEKDLFFDGLNKEKANDLAGDSLSLKLNSIYGYRAEYIVPFLSEDYDNSSWTRLERKAINRARHRVSDKIVLAASFDDISRKDFPRDEGFINCSKGEQYVAAEIYQKISNRQRPERELCHVNNIVANIENTISGWGTHYIDIRDIFEYLKKEQFPVFKLKKHIPIWETKEEFPSSKLNLKPVDILDYFCDYNKESKYKALLQFLIVFCDMRETSKIVNKKLILDKVLIASNHLGHNFDSLCDYSLIESDSADLTFNNRERILKKVFESYVPYKLITAPKDYGKSLFLKKLRDKYNSEGLITYNCDINQLEELDSPDALSEALGFLNKKDLINNICRYSEQVRQDGLVFIFNVKQIKEAFQLKIIRLIFEELRTDIISRLERDYEMLSLSIYQFKLVVSCPYLYGRAINGNAWPYSYDVTPLSEFDYSTVLNTLIEKIKLKSKLKAYKRLKKLSKKEVASIASKITLMSAGHPKVVNFLVESYCANSYLSVLKTRKIIHGNSLLLSLSKSNPVLYNLFISKKIPLYRYINDKILAEIMHHAGIVERRDVFQKIISHNLYQEYLIKGEKIKLLRDSLLRRTCAIDYCYSQPIEFIKACNKAKEFYQSCISECCEPSNIRMLFLIEYWFSISQKKLASFSLKQSDFKLHVKDFFDETNVIDDINQLLSCETKIDIDLFKNKLIDFLNQDDEFQLLLNYKVYQLDAKCISKNHYTNLLRLINSFQD